MRGDLSIFAVPALFFTLLPLLVRSGKYYGWINENGFFNGSNQKLATEAFVNIETPTIEIMGFLLPRLPLLRMLTRSAYPPQAFGNLAGSRFGRFPPYLISFMIKRQPSS